MRLSASQGRPKDGQVASVRFEPAQACHEGAPVEGFDRPLVGARRPSSRRSDQRAAFPSPSIVPAIGLRLNESAGRVTGRAVRLGVPARPRHTGRAAARRRRTASCRDRHGAEPGRFPPGSRGRDGRRRGSSRSRRAPRRGRGKRGAQARRCSCRSACWVSKARGQAFPVAAAGRIGGQGRHGGQEVELERQVIIRLAVDGGGLEAEALVEGA